VKKLVVHRLDEVGKVLMAQCASTIKKLSLDLAGMRHSSSSTTRFDAAVEGAVASEYRNTGQNMRLHQSVACAGTGFTMRSRKLAAAVKE